MDIHTLSYLERRWRERLDRAVEEQNLHRVLVALEIIDEINADIEEIDRQQNIHLEYIGEVCEYEKDDSIPF